MKYFIKAFLFMIYFLIFNSYKCKKLNENKFYINKESFILNFFSGSGPKIRIRLPNEYKNEN